MRRTKNKETKSPKTVFGKNINNKNKLLSAVGSPSSRLL
jgi:hypothetical protein